MSNPCEFKNVSFSYKKQKILNNISFRIEPNEVVGLLGPNGVGKSTLLRIAVGLLPSDSGTVTQFGKDVLTLTQADRGLFGFDSVEMSLPSTLKVKDVLGFVSSTYANWNHNLSDQLLKRFDIDASKYVSKLSTGMKRKLGILCGVAHEPRFLVLDESFSGLDIMSRLEAIDVLTELSLQNTAIIYATHILSDVERLVSKVMLLKENKIIAQEDIELLPEKYFMVRCLDVKNIPGKVLYYYKGKYLVLSDNLRLEKWQQAEGSNEFVGAGLEDFYVTSIHGEVFK